MDLVLYYVVMGSDSCLRSIHKTCASFCFYIPEHVTPIRLRSHNMGDWYNRNRQKPHSQLVEIAENGARDWVEITKHVPPIRSKSQNMCRLLGRNHKTCAAYWVAITKHVPRIGSKSQNMCRLFGLNTKTCARPLYTSPNQRDRTQTSLADSAWKNTEWEPPNVTILHSNKKKT